MQLEQIDKFKKIFFLSSTFCLIFQIIIFDSFTDLLTVLLIFFSNIICLKYCFNKKIFFQYPISSFMIFFSHFINVGGSIFLKTLEFSKVNIGLDLPISTVIHLISFNIIIILSHQIYINSVVLDKIKKKLQNLIFSLKLFNIGNKNFIIFLSIISILPYLFAFDLFTPVSQQRSEQEILNAPLFNDILTGMNYLISIGAVTYFCKEISGDKIEISKNLFISIFFIILIFISLARNSRSVLFDFILLFFLTYFILIMLNKIKIEKKNVLKFFLLIFLLFPSFFLLENLSSFFLSERDVRYERSPIENFASIFNSNIFNNSKKKAYERKYSDERVIFSELYYDSSILNRANILKIHDNFNKIKKNIPDYKIENLKQLQISKIISIFPQPLINFFLDSFNKEKYRYSTASYLYGNVDYGGGQLKIGSALMTMSIIYGYWFYLILLFLFIPSFVFFDSFFRSEKLIFSPFIILFFYDTGGGIFNYISSVETYLWPNMIFRVIPQTLIFILIFRFIFNFFRQKI